MVPRAIAFYRSIKASNRPGAIRPTPPRVKLCLNALYAFVITALILTLPYFTPPNIYRETNSRLAIPTTTLFTRLETLRSGALTPQEFRLREKYNEASNDFGLLYAGYGPDVMADCIWCSTANTDTYFMYAITSILTPHLFHIFILAIITSSFFSGSEGHRWRLYATVGGAFLAVSEVVLVLTNDWKLNTTKRVLAEVDFFYWRMRLYRLLAFAAMDALLGWAIWLTSTNRWLVRPPHMTQQLQQAALAVHATRIKVSLLSRLRNTITHDDQLLATGMNAWVRDVRDTDELEREREVVDAKKIALTRIDVDKVKREAEHWVNQVWAFIGPRTQENPSGHAKTE